MMRWSGLTRYALRVEFGLAIIVLIMAIFIFIFRGLSDALALAAIVFFMPQPFLLFTFWQASRTRFGGGK